MTADEVDSRFRAALVAAVPSVASGDPHEPMHPDSGLTGQHALELLDAQMTSRHLDLAARRMRAAGDGFYTIGSAGHEGNAAIAAALRPTDPALLHYRSVAFYVARAAQLADAKIDPIADVLRGIAAVTTDPISGGRHKVIGHPQLNIIPTTSTIASHLPRAVGLAFAIERAQGKSAARIRIPWPGDAIVVCSFGDASINHATATAAFNTIGYSDFTGLRLPLLLVCEDNGLGISVRSPAGWVGTALKARPGLRYFLADGGDLAETYAVARSAVAWIRRHRRPAVLHLRTVRLMGHAGADAELGYRTQAEIERDLALDPVLRTAQMLVAAGQAEPMELLGRYDEIGWKVRQAAEHIRTEPRLASAAEVISSLSPRRPVRVINEVIRMGSQTDGPHSWLAAQALSDGPHSWPAAQALSDGPHSWPAAQALSGSRDAAHQGKLPEQRGPLTLAQSINATLTDVLSGVPKTLLFGEDVARKGGVYGVTKGLRDRFGPSRVFDTLLDETTILGMALGTGLAGMLPIPEIQYLAYLHNAEDQLRGEAATMRFFSQGAYRNPMVVRIAGLAYQQGFGGHFHNDHSVAVLRDIPGLVIAVPARPDDAAAMLRTCVAAAEVDGTVCVYLEPIALYHTRDLYADGDGGWLASYAAPSAWGETHVPVGRARVYPFATADRLTIITFGNGVRMSLRVAARLAKAGHGCRVVDLRWLSPLPNADLIREATATGRVLVVDETRRTGGVAEGVLATLVDAGYVGLARRVSAVDTFLPLGPATKHVLVGEDAIERAARALLSA